ncbi:MAG: glycosyltransferase family 39 protein, partial [Anaerolineae bacterium]|nr:glycosyltransferase family 39 protein [Anaerolineae bacterium]
MWPAWPVTAGIVLAAGLLRLVPWLADYPLHRDEALYGYWARLIASGQDPLLLTPWIDKPPLSIYLIASSFAGLGVSELTSRLPGLVASILTVPALYALAERAYDRQTARLAAGLFALSPFAILFAPTAFTDPWLTLWLVIGAWAALLRRGFVAGLAAGLAVASKQQGVLVGPLLIALLLAPTRADPGGWRHRLRALLAAVAGFALVFGPLTWWDSLRWHNRPSFWDRSLTTYGPLVVAPLSLWPSRAADWAEQLGYLFGFPALSWTMLALAAWAGVRALRDCVERPHEQRTPLATLIVAGYATGYLVLHLVVTFQPWDRYLLPLVPLVCLLAARGMALIQLTKVGQMHLPPATPRWMKVATCQAPSRCLARPRRFSGQLPMPRPVPRRMKMPTGLEPLGGFSRHAVTRLKPRVQVAGRRFSGQMPMPRPAPRRMKMPTGLEPLGGFSRHAANRLKPRVQVAGRRFSGQMPHAVLAAPGWTKTPTCQALWKMPGTWVVLFSGQLPLPQREIVEDEDSPPRISTRMHEFPVAPFVYSRHIRKWLAAVVLAVALGVAAWLGAAGRIPVGSDHGAYAGIRQVAAFLREQPAETIVYHQSLGWYFDFYLFDAPQERRWFDTPEKLADEVTRTIEVQPAVPQWLVIPEWEADRLAAWQPVLTAHGLTLTDLRYVYRPDGSRSFE